MPRLKQMKMQGLDAWFCHHPVDKVALYFATPSAVQPRDDDWHEDQRTLPVSSVAWEGRGEGW